MPSREELDKIMLPPPKPPIVRRYHYKQCFISSPALGLRIVEICRISDGIALLEALGNGELMVSVDRRKPGQGYFAMATATLKELRGKSEAEIYKLLDYKTDEL